MQTKALGIIFLLFLVNIALVNAEEISVVGADIVWEMDMTDAASVDHLSGEPGVIVVKYADTKSVYTLEGTENIVPLSGEPGVIVVKYADTKSVYSLADTADIYYLSGELGVIVVKYADAINVHDMAKSGAFGDTPPVLASIGNKTATVNSLLSFTISAIDDESDPITYSATGLPTGATLDETTGEFSWTPGNGTAGDYDVTFIATANGLSDSENITITVTVSTNDWNPWNDSDSDGGEAITLVELQDAIYCWRFGETVSTGELVDLVRLQDLIYSWRFG